MTDTGTSARGRKKRTKDGKADENAGVRVVVKGNPMGIAAGTPKVMTALSEQPGLRLEPVKAPVEMVVIDHIEKPDAN